MSNLGQAVTSVIGATIGFFIGGPTGALYGFQAGLLGGSLIFPTKLPGVEGPRLEDFETLQSDPGAPIFHGWGTFALPGFRLYLGPVTEVSTTEEVGGKGPPSQEVTTFQYFQTAALGIHDGLIKGILRVWENGSLVYDVRGQQPGETDDAYTARVAMSSEYADTFTLYLGTEEQLADPTLELEQGTGNVPAFRGLAYIVYPDRELKQDQGNRHPAFKFEVTTTEADQVVFTESGIYTVPENITTVDVLVVAGGGSGGRVSAGTNGTGGGGAGGVVYETGIAVTPGDEIAVTVGAGGVFSVGSQASQKGEDSSFLTITAVGGGRGGNEASTLIFGGPGGSGGGGAATLSAAGSGGAGTADQGNAGGDAHKNTPFVSLDGRGGGGGGAGSPGVDATSSSAGDGGDGLDFSGIFGTSVGDDGWFGGGGAGTADKDAPTRFATGGRGGGGSSTISATGDTTGSTAGQANTGGGGASELPGGSGIVIVKPHGTARAKISDIVTDVLGRANEDIEVDVSALEDRFVQGYVLTRQMTARSALEPLRTVGMFDVIESEAKLKFPVRGGASVATLTDDDLGAVEEGQEAPPAVTGTKVQDVELPRQIQVRYPSSNRDYEPGQQISQPRFGTASVNDVTVQVPVIMTDERAAEVAEIMFREAWASRWSHEFTLDASWFQLEPADVVLIPVNGRLQRVRIGTFNDAALMIRRAVALRDDDGAYISHVVPSSPERPTPIVHLLGDTSMVLLDLPALRDDDDSAGIYVAVRRSGTGQYWQGAQISRSIDGGATYARLLNVDEQAVIGTVVSAPAAGDGYTWDNAGEYVIDILSGELESRTDQAVLAGANAAAVGADGRWHVFQFASAELVSTGRYRLTRLLLGRRGTEHLIGTVQAGDTFVLVSGAGIYRATLQTAEIGVSRIYRAVTAGAAFSTGTDVPFTGSGEALETFSPVHIRGSRDGSENLTITWLRRDRLSPTLRDGVTLPLNEASEAYEVDILDEYDEVIRTIEDLTTAEATYSAAEQVTDFGSAQASVSVKVYQLSADVGRGTPGEATV